MDGVHFSTKIIIITHDLLLSFIDLFIICSCIHCLFIYLSIYFHVCLIDYLLSI